jgi:hypothetical protein
MWGSETIERDLQPQQSEVGEVNFEFLLVHTYACPLAALEINGGLRGFHLKFYSFCI